jgi:hypothetical protein
MLGVSLWADLYMTWEDEVFVARVQFFRQCISIVFQRALASAIERKITLTGDACSTPPITIRLHDVHVGDIKRAMGGRD